MVLTRSYFAVFNFPNVAQHAYTPRSLNTSTKGSESDPYVMPHLLRLCCAVSVISGAALELDTFSNAGRVFEFLV